MKEVTYGSGVEVLFGLKLRTEGRQFDGKTAGVVEAEDQLLSARAGRGRVLRVDGRWTDHLFQIANRPISQRRRNDQSREQASEEVNQLLPQRHRGHRESSPIVFSVTSVSLW